MQSSVHASSDVTASVVEAPLPPKKAKLQKKKIRVVDPNAPKRNLTSYVIFSNYIRPILKKKFPDITFVELSKQMGIEFKKLSSEDRKVWDLKAKEDKERYERELKHYILNVRGNDGQSSIITNNSVPLGMMKDPDAPKKALSSYNFYFSEVHEKFRNQNPDATFGALSKLIGIEFKKLTPDERQKWELLAIEDKKRYEKELANYIPPNRIYKGSIPVQNSNRTISMSITTSTSSEINTNLNCSNKKKKKRRIRDANEPKKNLTSYFLFSTALREDLKIRYPEASFCELGRLSGVEFRKLSPEQRKVWDDRALEDKKRYDAEMQIFLAEKKKKADAIQEAVVLPESEVKDEETEAVIDIHQKTVTSEDIEIEFVPTEMPFPKESPLRGGKYIATLVEDLEEADHTEVEICDNDEVLEGIPIAQAVIES